MSAKDIKEKLLINKKCIINLLSFWEDFNIFGMVGGHFHVLACILLHFGISKNFWYFLNSNFKKSSLFSSLRINNLKFLTFRPFSMSIFPSTSFPISQSLPAHCCHSLTRCSSVYTDPQLHPITKFTQSLPKISQ